MMQPGYYWACHAVRGWRIVEAVKGLHGCVLEGGYAVRLREYSEFEQVPLPGAQTTLDAAYAELHDLRIRAGMVQP